MANYLATHYKGKYRLLPEICLNTNDFPKYPSEEDKNIDVIDEDMIHIACQHGNKIWYWGLNESRRAVLGAYIPSVGRGRNIKKYMTKNKINFYDYDESDEEVVFKFLASDIEVVADLLKAKTNGAKTPPFSSKNLPKSDVVIPEEEIEKFKSVTSKINKNDMWLFKDINDKFLTDILEKSLKKSYRKKSFSCIDDMVKLKMSRQFKEYVFLKGYWDQYINFIDEEFKKYYNNK